jgi:hypothetical protein
MILGDSAPKSCIPIDAEILVMYCRFKFWLKGEPLTDLNNNPVNDALGQPIECVGQWEDPRCGQQLNSAMTGLHTSRKCHGPYQDPCDACCALAKTKKHLGCDEHTGIPRLRRCGNPTNAPEFKNELKAMMDLGKKRGYKVGGSSTCLPGDYRDARAYLISHNTNKALMMYCLMLFSARAYLRKVGAPRCRRGPSLQYWSHCDP